MLSIKNLGRELWGLGGDIPASTQPQDFDNKNSNWNKVGPTPAELKKELETKKRFLRDAEKNEMEPEILEKYEHQSRRLGKSIRRHCPRQRS